jgi:hypothetical protein
LILGIALVGRSDVTRAAARGREATPGLKARHLEECSMRNSMFLVLALAAGANAGQYYGGDPNQISGLANAESFGGGANARVYEDFSWSGGFVGSLFSNNIDFGGGTDQGYFWEIRSGAGPGNPGVLVADSNSIGGVSSYVASGFNWNGIPVNQLMIDVNDFNLAPGDYHFAVVPGAGTTYVVTTDGTNSIGGPIENGKALFDSVQFATFWGDVDSIYGIDHNGYSMGINPGIPAPGSAALLGLVGLAASRRRRA